MAWGNSTDRVWIANGRVRWAIRIDNRQRQADEDATFCAAFPDPCASNPDDRQRVLAVELDQANARLFTLTEAMLVVEDVTDPHEPDDPAVFDLHASGGGYPALYSTEVLLDVKVWANSGQSYIFVLTSKRIVTLVYNPSAQADILYVAQTEDLFDANTGPLSEFIESGDEDFDDLHVSRLNRMRILEDEASGNGPSRLMAYVLAEADAYASTPGRPKPRIVMACDLSADSFSTPTFNADPEGRRYVYYNPMAGMGGEDNPRDFEAIDLAAVEVSNEIDLYVACGKLRQLQKLDATDSFEEGYGLLDPSQITIQEGEHLLNVLIDKNESDRVFVASEGRSRSTTSTSAPTPRSFRRRTAARATRARSSTGEVRATSCRSRTHGTTRH